MRTRRPAIDRTDRYSSATDWLVTAFPITLIGLTAILLFLGGRA